MIVLAGRPPTRRLLRASVRYPRTVVGIVAVVTLLGSVFIPRIDVRLDGRSLVPTDHPSMRASDEAAAAFGLRDRVVLAVRNRDSGVYTTDGLARIASLGDELAKCDGIVRPSIASLATLPRMAIRDDGLDLQPLLGRGGRIDEALAGQLRAETEGLGLNDNVLVARDGKAAAIYADIEPDADRRALRTCVSALVASGGGGGHEVFVSGTAMAQAVLGEAAVTDLTRLIPLVIVIVGAILTAAFRHPAPALLSLTEVGVSLILTAELMGLFRQQVFVTTLSLPVIILVIGVSDDLYALNQFFAERRRQPGAKVTVVVQAAFETVRLPVTITALTTALGLLSLLTTSLEPLRVFGLFGACSVLISALFTFTLVPALLVLAHPRGSEIELPGRAFASAVLGRLVGTVGRIAPIRVVAAATILAGAAATVGTRVHIEDSWVGNLPPSSDVARGDRAINEALAGTNTIELMFDAGASDGYLDRRRLNALGEIERTLMASPHVGAVHSAYGDVVRVMAALHGRTYASYRAALTRDEARLSGQDVQVAALLLDSLDGTPRIARFDREHRRARMTVFIRGANYSRTAEVLRVVDEADRAVNGAAGRIVPFGDGWIGYNTIHLIVAGQVSSILFATISDTAVLAVLLMSVPAALLAMAPVVCAIALLFAMLALTGTPIGTASSMFAAIALGIGADYSIHLVTACRVRLAEGQARAEAMASALAATGPPILMSAVALPLGFLVLAGSAVRPNRQLGTLIAASMAVCAVLTLVLVPALMRVRAADLRGLVPVRLLGERPHDREQRQLGSRAVDANAPDKPV